MSYTRQVRSKTDKIFKNTHCAMYQVNRHDAELWNRIECEKSWDDWWFSEGNA